MRSCSPLRATINLGLWHILHGNANKIHQIINFRPKQVSTKIAIAQFVSEKSLCLSDSFLMTVILYTIVNFSTCLKSAWLPPCSNQEKCLRALSLSSCNISQCVVHTHREFGQYALFIFLGGLFIGPICRYRAISNWRFLGQLFWNTLHFNEYHRNSISPKKCLVQLEGGKLTVFPSDSSSNSAAAKVHTIASNASNTTLLL